MTWSNMDRKLKIYLAGKMSGLTYQEMGVWRQEIENKFLIQSMLANYTIMVLNPVKLYNFEEVKHQSEKEIMNYDISHVVTSDIIIVNLDGLATSDGSKIEIYEANYNRKIPVIAFGDKELYNNLHPWLKECITRVEKNIEDVVDYVRDFYMI